MGGDGASRFSRLKFLCMLGVFDSAGPLRTHICARSRVAFWCYDPMGVPIRTISELNIQPKDAPIQRFECGLAAALAWLGARVVRYSFPVRLFHSLLQAGLSRRYPPDFAHATFAEFGGDPVMGDGLFRAHGVRISGIVSRSGSCGPSHGLFGSPAGLPLSAR